MIGYYNPQHQGFCFAKTARVESCPYPMGSRAYLDFYRGVSFFNDGLNWDGEAVGASRLRKHLRGTATASA
jgi:hypothetical protein